MSDRPSSEWQKNQTHTLWSGDGAAAFVTSASSTARPSSVSLRLDGRETTATAPPMDFQSRAGFPQLATDAAVQLPGPRVSARAANFPWRLGYAYRNYEPISLRLSCDSNHGTVASGGGGRSIRKVRARSPGSIATQRPAIPEARMRPGDPGGRDTYGLIRRFGRSKGGFGSQTAKGIYLFLSLSDISFCPSVRRIRSAGATPPLLSPSLHSTSSCLSQMTSVSQPDDLLVDG
jgi:hypothetical protein